MYQSRSNQEIRYYTGCFNKESNIGVGRLKKQKGCFLSGKRVTAENRYQFCDWGTTTKKTLVRATRLQKLEDGLYRTSVHTCKGCEKAAFVTTKRSWDQLLLWKRTANKQEGTSGVSFLLPSCLPLVPLLAESFKKFNLINLKT